MSKDKITVWTLWKRESLKNKILIVLSFPFIFPVFIFSFLLFISHFLLALVRNLDYKKAFKDASDTWFRIFTV